jgi:4-aminobutyrate aminotransferase-like enzyme
MAGIDVHYSDGRADPVTALQVVKQMLERGFILLPEGEHGSVISLTPPLVITPRQLQQTIHHLEQVLGA